MNTIRRHEQRFKKYFSGSSLLHKNVRRIDRLSLESEMNRIVKDHDLTHKEYNQVKSMVSRMLAYAVDKSMIPENLAGRITISVKFRQTARKDSSTQIYQGAEYDSNPPLLTGALGTDPGSRLSGGTFPVPYRAPMLEN